MPIAGYVDFGACVTGMQDKQGYDKETAEKVCGAIERDIQKSELGSKYLEELKEEYGNEARLFVGNLSVDVKDKEGDQITLDAFKKVMPIFMRRGVLIDSHTNRVIGRPLKYWTDEDSGATTVGWQIYDDYHIDDEAWGKIRNGTYEGMSIGGFAHPDGQETVCDGSGCKVIIKEIELWEGSAVKRGANTEAVILAHNELAKSDDAENSGEPEGSVSCEGDSCEITPKVPIMPDNPGILTKSEKTMTDETKETKKAEDTGSVDESVDSAGTDTGGDGGGDTGGEGGGEVEKQDEGEPVGATVEEKIDAAIELLQNLAGRVEALEDVTAPVVEDEEKQDDEKEPIEADEDEVEKSATELATDVATKAIDQVAAALPGMINKSLKNAGIIHAPRPEMKEAAGKPLEKQDDKVVSMDDVGKMGKDDIRVAGNDFASMATRGGR